MKNKIFSFILASLTIWLASFYWIIVKVFGNIDCYQIAWHLKVIPLVTVYDEDIIRHIIQLIFFLFILMYLFYYLIFKVNKIEYGINKLSHKLFNCSFSINEKIYISFLSVIIISSFCLVSYKINARFHVKEYIAYQLNKENPKEDFYEKNYFVPKIEEISFKRKNNVIVILAESLEKTFYAPEISKSYLPKLEKFSLEYISNDNYNIGIHGLKWTIGAITAWNFGLPIKLGYNVDPNSYFSHTFLPKALSIFDVLKKNNYNLSMVMGSSSDFAGCKILCQTHGGFSIYDRDYFEKQGWDLQKYSGIKFWGYNDKFTMDRAFDEFIHLKNKNEPFVLFVQLIDTHAPDGYCPKENKVYGDIRDAFLEFDKNLYAFLDKLKQNIDDHTIVMVIGDHGLQLELDFFSYVKQRKIYNVFFGNLPDIPSNKLQEKMTALDIAPTILQSAGAKWENDQFGLGISLFSKESTLIEKYGEKEFDRLLTPESKFYDNFF